METGQYEYFAFISYKREDEKWAKWLQKKLESYSLPTAIRKENPELPNKIRPVFRDQSELSGGNLKAEIEKGLNRSRYLIVICSPRSAKSPWVSKEVQHFINQRREEYIIPFIIGGTPNATNPEEECFPEGLRQLTGEKEILGININEMGRDAAAIKVIARMFDLRFDTLWQRHKKQEEKEKILLKKRHDELFKLQGKIVASKCKEHIERGDSYLAVKLALAFLNKSNKIDNLPYIPEIEETLRLATKKRDCIYFGHSYNITALAFSPVENLLVTGSDDCTLRLWNTENGQPIAILEQRNGLSSSVDAISFDASGKLMASSASRSIRIWCVSTLQVLEYFEDSELEISSRISSVNFYKDDIVYSNYCQIILYNRKQHFRTVIYEIEEMIERIKIDIDLQCLFCISKNNLYVFRIIDDKLRLIKRFQGCTHFDIDINIHQFVTEIDELTSLWDYRLEKSSPESLRIDKKNDFHKNGLTYLSKDGINVYCFSDGIISVYRTEVAKEKPIMTWQIGNIGAEQSAIWFDQDKELFYIVESSEVKQIDVHIERARYITIEHPVFQRQKISAFTIDTDNRVFAVSKDAGQELPFKGLFDFNPNSIADYLNKRDSGMIMRFDIHGHDLYYLQIEDINSSDIKLSYNDSYIVVNYYKGFRIIDSDSLQSIYEMNPGYNVKASPGARRSSCLVCLTAEDGFAVLETDFLKRIDLWSGLFPRNLKYSSGKVILTLSHTRKLLCFAYDKILSIISLDTHKEVFSLSFKCEIWAVCFSNDTKRIAVATDGDYALSVFDLKTTKRIAYKPLFKTFISSVHYSDDDKYLITCGDRKIMILSTDGYTMVDEMTGELSHNGIMGAVFKDDMIVSLDSIGYLRRWDFEPLNILIEKENDRFGSFTLSDERLLENYII